MRHFFSVFLVFALLTAFSSANAGPSALDFTIHQEYTSSRALGMGNAFTAVVDDHSAIFYNPAALAFREKGNLRMFLRAGIDKDYPPFITDLTDATSGGTDAEQIDGINEVLSKNLGNHLYSRVPTLGAVWARPGWGIAFIPADLSLDLVPHQNAGYSIGLNGYLDSTLAYSYAKKFKWFDPHEFAIGATAKIINRINASKEVLSVELLDSSEVFVPSDAREGLTFDLDVGTLFVPQVGDSFWKYAKPSVAVVVRNLLDIGFPTNLHLISEEDNAKEPTQLYRRFDVGSKLEFPKFWVFQPKFAFDIRDIGHPNWNLAKGSHLGVELFWQMYNWWKGYWSFGLNQNYLSAGFGSRFGIFQLDLTTWGEEVGTSSEPRESRRYMVEMSLDF